MTTNTQDALRVALERIARWYGEFPDTGMTWDDGTPMSYQACYGSNGERDYMRQVAITALSAAPASEQQPIALDSLTRYGWTESYIGQPGELVEDANGYYVRYADVIALLAQQAADSSASLTREQIAKTAGSCMPTPNFNLFMSQIDDAIASSQPEGGSK